MPDADLMVYGFGNPGRGDDGLGVAFADAVAQRCPGVRTDSNYQLNVEDALAISGCGTVVFADASRRDIDGFAFSRLAPAASVSFTTHAMAPSSVLAFCEQLYGARPAAYLMEIRGSRWEVGEGLSAAARRNLSDAVEFLAALVARGAPLALAEAVGPAAAA